MKELKIGNLTLPLGLMLAPMAGVTDTAFRSVCKEHGAEYMVSEMISAKAIHFQDPKTAALSAILPKERPMAVQLFGREPHIMAEAAKRLCDRADAPDVIDLNMGCPVKKITGNGEGSALMKDPQLAGEIVRAVKQAVSVPVTAKFRTGWSASQRNAVEFGMRLEACGVDAICIHGRTKEQMYAPPVDYDTIAAVKNALTIPVVGNGGIENAETAKRMLETGCDGLMLARGAMGNPWIFEEIRCLITGRDYLPPSVTERLTVAQQHMERLLAEKGTVIGTAEARKHLAWYLHGLAGASAARGRLNTVKSLEEIQRILSDIAAWNA